MPKWSDTKIKFYHLKRPPLVQSHRHFTLSVWQESQPQQACRREQGLHVLGRSGHRLACSHRCL